MYTIVEVDLGKTEEDGNDIFGTDNNLNEPMVEKIIKKVMKVTLGLFDEWGGENNEDGDVWGDSPEYVYQKSEFMS